MSASGERMKITLTTSSGVYPDAEVRFEHYGNGAVAIQLGDDEGLICTATVNIPDAPLLKGCVWIKTWSENEGVLESLVDAGIVKPTGRTTQTGFATAVEARVLKEPTADRAHWFEVGEPYLPEHLRGRFQEVCGQATWREPNGTFPFSPGSALKSIIDEYELQQVSSVTYSQVWEVNDTTYELPTGMEHPDLIATFTIIGVKAWQLVFWFLDMGVQIVPVVYEESNLTDVQDGEK